MRFPEFAEFAEFLFPIGKTPLSNLFDVPGSMIPISGWWFDRIIKSKMFIILLIRINGLRTGEVHLKPDHIESSKPFHDEPNFKFY